MSTIAQTVTERAAMGALMVLVLCVVIILPIVVALMHDWRRDQPSPRGFEVLPPEDTRKGE